MISEEKLNELSIKRGWDAKQKKLFKRVYNKMYKERYRWTPQAIGLDFLERFGDFVPVISESMLEKFDK